MIMRAMENPNDYAGDVVIPGEVTYDGSTYSVTTIGEYAFGWCEALTSVEMPEVTTINGWAFSYCYALTSVEMPTVTTIGDESFYCCEALTSVEMPAVTTINGWAFSYCSALTSAEMPAVTTIGVRAFYYCYDLTSVSMPEVTTIGDGAFSGCSSLASVFIPSSCTSIDANPFVECVGLKEIVVDDNNPNYSSADGVLYDKGKTTLIGWPAAKGDIDILPSVTTIGEYAFGGCDTLTSVSMPEVTAIGEFAFNGCFALTSVEMPAVTTIGEYAFGWCEALTSVEMPAVTTIGIWAFFYCSALTSVDIPASVTMIGYGAFDECSSLTSVCCHWDEPLECEPEFTRGVLMNATLYVPDGCIDAYRSVFPWSEFLNIEEKDYSGIADTPGSGLSVKVIDGAIIIGCGDGMASAPVVEVYSAGGQCLYRGTDSSIGGLPRGVYVVKVDGTVQKVAL